MIKILAVDDNRDNLLILKAIIQDSLPEVSVLTATNGATGLKLAQEHDPDVILLDIVMPGMDGYEVCKRLKKGKKTLDIPVVFLTALKSEPQTRISALEAGGEGFLNKPVDEPELVAQIRTMVKIKEARLAEKTGKDGLEDLISQRTAELKHELDERLKVEEALQESERKFREVFNSTNEVIFIGDTEGRLIDCNDRAVSMYGYGSKEEILRCKPGELSAGTEPYNAENARKHFLRALKKGPHSFEWLEKKKNGELFWVEVSLKLTEIQGRERLLAVVRDISRRKEIEEKQRETERRFSTLLHNLPGMVYRCANNREWTMESVSKGCMDLTGYAPEELINNAVISFNELIVPEDRQRLWAKWQDILKRRTYFQDEYRIRTKTGEIKWLWEHGCGVYADDGQLTALEGFIADVTESRMAEEKLKEHEDRLRHIFNHSTNVFYSHDTDHIIQYLSPQVEQLLGYREEEALVRWTELVSDNPINQVGYTNTVKAIETGIAQDPYELELIHKSGKKVWVEVREAPLVVNGKTTAIVGSLNDITQRKKTEKQIRQVTENWNATFNAIRDRITLLDSDQHILQSNFAFRDYFNMDEEELIHKHCFQIIHQTDNPVEGCVFQRMKASKQREIMELMLNGSVCEVIVDPIMDENNEIAGAVHIISDITDRKLNEKALRESEEKYRLIAENMGNIVSLLDLNLQYTYISPSVEYILGYKPEELLKKHVNLILPVESQQTVFEIMQEEIQAEASGQGDPLKVRDLDLLEYKKDGTMIWVENILSFIRDETNAPVGILAVSRDITERVEANRELLKAKERAEESDRLKSAFLANMSHEIRTPMNGILGFISLMQDPGVSPELFGEYLELISMSSQRLLSTINDIIEISQIEAGQAPIQMTEVDLGEMLDYLHRFFLPEAGSKGLKFSLSCQAPDDRLRISTDKNKLESILTNLIKNALKFTRKGEIRIGCRLKENIFTFSVSDTGMGIPEDRLDAIFERFVQADLKITRNYEGAGLGLSISRAYAEMLGGKIWAESEYGRGSNFYFTIPFTPALKKKEAAEEKTAGTRHALSKTGATILIVEDDEASYKFLEAILAQENYGLIHARNGLDALQIFGENPGIDLILIDIKMPLMDGYETTRKIRQVNAGVPIIAQTAYALPGDREKALQAGCQDYISKPILKEDLISMISAQLERYLSQKPE